MKAVGKYTNSASQKAVLDARDVYHRVWFSACNYDDIPVNSRFVVFSEDNPFVFYVNKAYQELIQRISEYQSGGYVGLRISGCAKKEHKIQKDKEIQYKIQKAIALRKQLAILDVELG